MEDSGAVTGGGESGVSEVLWPPWPPDMTTHWAWSQSQRAGNHCQADAPTVDIMFD